MRNPIRAIPALFLVLAATHAIPAQPANRVVVAGRATVLVVDTVYLFPEAAGAVIGVSRIAQGAGDFLSLVDAGFRSKSVLEQEVGAEALAALRPDAVVMKNYMLPSLGKAAESIGVRAVSLDLESPEAFLEDVAKLGRLFGNETRARVIRDYYLSRTRFVAGRVAGAESGPSVLLLHAEEGGSEYRVPPIEWLQSRVVRLAGGRPVWGSASASSWVAVGAEQVAAWNPEVVLVVSYRTRVNETVEALLRRPEWRALQAVKNEMVFGFPGDFFSWDQPNPRWILGLQWLAKKLNPTQFADLDLRSEVSSFFSRLYGLDPAVVSAKILPRISGSFP